MAYYNQGVFKPMNQSKYVGTGPITYRSAWELTFMSVCDKHPNIIAWSSESIQIPYQHPLTAKWHRYIPDFFIQYLDKDGAMHGEIIEIKPMNQTVMELARNQKAQEIVAVNHAKWKAAVAWCAQNGLKFRIMTAEQLYRTAKK